MELSSREIWTVLHGMVLGAVFLLAFGGAVTNLYDLNGRWLTPAGAISNGKRLRIGLWTMAVIAWATVITGTWVVYIWYRAKAPPGADLIGYPKSFLISKPSTSGWHDFGMEWKEHVSWITPMIITSLAFCAQYYGQELKRLPRMRQTMLLLLVLAFAGAASAGIFGAFINKVAATR